MFRQLIALPLLVVTASAASASDDTFCRNGLFPQEPPFALAEIAGEDRVHFHEDMEGCPWTGNDCSSDAYVIPGDTVLISKISNGYACAYYPSGNGGTAGWIATAPLRLLPMASNPPQSAWLGEWSDDGNPSVSFSEELGRLHVTGKAYWPGPPETTDWPSIHEGGIDGSATRLGYRANYDDGACKVAFTLLEPFLIAGDNHQCGGMNVRFSGVYQRVGD